MTEGPPAHAGRDTARRVIPLFRPYRVQVAFVVGLIVVTSTVGIVNPLQTVVTTTASTILANVVTFVSSIVAMIIISWQLTIVSVFTVPAFFWLTRAVGQRRRRVSKSTQEALAAMSALTEEYQEQFDAGRVQWRCSDGDVLADGTVRQRAAQSA